MVIVLARIVEEAGVLAEGVADDVLQRLAFEAALLQQVVAGRDVGLVVLVVVELQRLPRHEGLQGVVRVGQVRQGERHSRLLDPRRGAFPSEAIVD